MIGWHAEEFVGGENDGDLLWQNVQGFREDVGTCTEVLACKN